MGKGKSQQIKTQKIYVLSGLGVDERAFKNLNWNDLPIHHVEWITPEKEETLKNYARRISSIITCPDPILIGLSFGGMLAVEIAKYMPVKKCILISSSKSRKEIPIRLKLMRRLGITKILPGSVMKKPNFVLEHLFGAKTEKEKSFLKEILADTNPYFLKWALNAITQWKNTTIPNNIISIHGEDDKILPIKNIKVDYTIKGGGHIMIVNKAKEIERVIRAILN